GRYDFGGARSRGRCRDLQYQLRHVKKARDAASQKRRCPYRVRQIDRRCRPSNQVVLTARWRVASRTSGLRSVVEATTFDTRIRADAAYLHTPRSRVEGSRRRKCSRIHRGSDSEMPLQLYDKREGEEEIRLL